MRTLQPAAVSAASPQSGSLPPQMQMPAGAARVGGATVSCVVEAAVKQSPACNPRMAGLHLLIPCRERAKNDAFSDAVM